MSARVNRTALEGSKSWLDNEYLGEKTGFFQGEDPRLVAISDAREIMSKYEREIREALESEAS